MEASSSLRRSASSLPSATTVSSRILMFTSWSEQSTPAELSIASVFTRHPPQRPDQLLRRQRLVLHVEGSARLRWERDGLRGAIEHAASRGETVAVVVRPRGTGQLEQASALLPADARVGVGVDEDLTVVEGPEQADVPRQQHAVAEHVAGHVADAHDGEVLALDVVAELAEMPLDRFPRPA